jgi:uncharacterized membrane protein YfcA
VTPVEAVIIVLAGLAAGTVNTIVGSGSLITFPTLLAFGYPPIIANVSNTAGLVAGSVSGAIGYRRELAGQRARAIRLGVVGVLGGLTGAVLLVALPETAFGRIVPVLVLFAVVLVAIQPRLQRSMAGRRDPQAREHPIALFVTVYLAAIYGGYFGAAQSVILIALLGIFLPDNLQRLNAVKNVLTALINAAAALLFIVAPLLPGLGGLPHVDWSVALLLALGSIVGGQVGALVGRRIPAWMLRALIVVVGTVVGVKLLIG